MSTASKKREMASDVSSETGRDRVLRCAAELFLARGYAETSLRAIAGEAGMQPASIYHHFESKDHLLTEILDKGMDAIMEAFHEAAEKAAGVEDGRLRLQAHVAGHLHALFAHQAFTAAHITCLLYTSPSPRDQRGSRMPSSA